MNTKAPDKENRQELANRCFNPVQPVFIDENGHARFKHNAIVRYLLDNGNIDLNHLSRISHKFSNDDRTQFAQLIGYSVSGAGELSYFSDKAYSVGIANTQLLLTGTAPLTELEEKTVMIAALEDEVAYLKQKLEAVKDILENE